MAKSFEAVCIEEVLVDGKTFVAKGDQVRVRQVDLSGFCSIVILLESGKRFNLPKDMAKKHFETKKKDLTILDIDDDSTVYDKALEHLKLHNLNPKETQTCVRCSGNGLWGSLGYCFMCEGKGVATLLQTTMSEISIKREILHRSHV
jgi:DnaJ-class molecular chaperone